MSTIVIVGANVAGGRAAETLRHQGFDGRIVLVGWSHGPVEVDTISLMRKEAEMVGSRNSIGAFPSVLRLLEDGVVDAAAMITHRFPFERAPEALRLLDHGEPALKIVVTGP